MLIIYFLVLVDKLLKCKAAKYVLVFINIYGLETYGQQSQDVLVPKLSLTPKIEV